MAQQTAVEWLIEQLIPKAMVTYDQTTYNVIQQAKAMEKQQIVDANINGQKNPHFSLESRISEAEQYYNENYNKKTMAQQTYHIVDTNKMVNMNKEFIPYEQALALEELGFDELCIATIDQTGYIHIKGTEYPIRGDMWYNTIKAPLYQQAFRWFREKYNIDISINTVYSKYNETTSKKYGGAIDNESVFTNVGFYDTYEEAELACLKKLIEIVKNK